MQKFFVSLALLCSVFTAAEAAVSIGNTQRVLPNYEMRMWGGITLQDVRLLEIRNALNGAVQEYQLTVLKKPAGCVQLGQGCGAALAFYAPAVVNEECALRVRVLASGGKWKMELVQTTPDKTFLAGKELHVSGAHQNVIDLTKVVYVDAPDAKLVGVLVNPYEVGKTTRAAGLGAVCQ